MERTVMITLAEGADYTAVVVACRNVGLKVETQRPGLDAITGSISDGAIDVLRDIPGVAAVEYDQTSYAG